MQLSPFVRKRLANMGRVYVAALIVLAAFALLSGCGGGDPEPEQVACLDTTHTEAAPSGSGHDVRVPPTPCREQAL